MARRKNKNSINQEEAVKFLKEVYRFSVQVVNEYHIKVRSEEYTGWFDWYHTTGTVVQSKMGLDCNFYAIRTEEKAMTDEDLALLVNSRILSTTYALNSLQ